ncbi:MAG: hypothetical protein IPK81_09280 [Rhodospirillales bacterium]|nr:MAG: hypothetical protein IPK81_09280 [Rhodospirillales bacterium]
MALKIFEHIEAQCALAAAARDAEALDDLARRARERVATGERGLREREAKLEAARAEIEKQRHQYRRWTIETARSEEMVEQANARGEPKHIMDSLQRRLDGVNLKRNEAKDKLVTADDAETLALEYLRMHRGRLGMVRVMMRSVEICIEKRRAELSPPPAVTAAPANPLDPPFSLAGTWGGGCDQGTKVGGTFRVAVAKGGAVSGQYVYSGGGSPGPLSGTLGPDGKLAVGSGDSSFSVRWVGSVVAAGGTRSGSGTWSGSGSGIKCGGSWTSGPPA